MVPSESGGSAKSGLSAQACSRSPPFPMAALFTQTSRRPHRSTTSLTAASQAEDMVVSPFRKTTSPILRSLPGCSRQRCAHSSTTGLPPSKGSVCTSITSTRAPLLAQNKAISRPIPDDAPVTTMTRPSSKAASPTIAGVCGGSSFPQGNPSPRRIQRLCMKMPTATPAAAPAVAATAAATSGRIPRVDMAASLPF